MINPSAFFIGRQGRYFYLAERPVLNRGLFNGCEITDADAAVDVLAER